MRLRSLRPELTGLLFISPWLIGALCFLAYPIGAALYYSFTDYNVLSSPRFVGLANYGQLFMQDPLFWTSVSNTLIFVVLSVPMSLAMALSLALLLNSRYLRPAGLFRTVYFLPSIIPIVPVVILWTWILAPTNGLLNTYLGMLGITGPGWFSSADWDKPALAVMSIWGSGGAMIIFLAGLKNVPQELYDAAAVDGANAWHAFWRITLPSISPTILFNVVIGLIGAFQYFTVVFVVNNGANGPLNSMLVFALYLYQNAFQYFKMGYASAMAWVLFIMVLASTLLVFRSSSRFVYYGGE